MDFVLLKHSWISFLPFDAEEIVESKTSERRVFVFVAQAVRSTRKVVISPSGDIDGEKIERDFSQWLRIRKISYIDPLGSIYAVETTPKRRGCSRGGKYILKLLEINYKLLIILI